MTAHESIDQSAFTDDMLDELGFYGLTPRQRAETVQQLNEALNERVGQVLTVSIDNDTLDEFGCFMDQDVSRMRAWLDRNGSTATSNEAQRFISRFIPPERGQQIALDVMLAFRKEHLGY